MAEQKNEISNRSQDKSSVRRSDEVCPERQPWRPTPRGPSAAKSTDRNRGGAEAEGQKLSAISEAAKEKASGMAENVRETVGKREGEGQRGVRGRVGMGRGHLRPRYRIGRPRPRTLAASGSIEMRRQSSQSVRRVRGGVQEYVSENPMVVGMVGLAAGMLIGALLPRTRRENEAFGEWADELRQQGVRYAREATQRGREFVEETFEGEDPRFSKHESEFKPTAAGCQPPLSARIRRT